MVVLTTGVLMLARLMAPEREPRPAAFWPAFESFETDMDEAPAPLSTQPVEISRRS